MEPTKDMPFTTPTSPEGSGLLRYWTISGTDAPVGLRQDIAMDSGSQRATLLAMGMTRARALKLFPEIVDVPFQTLDEMWDAPPPWLTKAQAETLRSLKPGS